MAILQVNKLTPKKKTSQIFLTIFSIFIFVVDSAPAEAVKRKVTEGEAKTDEAAEVTPEKKAKLEETSKEEVQNGAEASEVAA